MPENKIVLLGVLGAGAYLAYEYMQYSTEINTVAGGVAANIAQAEGALPFLTYVGMKWGIGTVAPGTGTTAQQQQQQLFNAMTGSPVASSQAPGTTSPGQPTSVSTTPPSTTTTTISTTPTPSSMQTLASNMEQTISMTSASADQWNWAFSHIIGQNIDAKYGFSFDAAYGGITNDGPNNTKVRNHGAKMSALMFLQLAAGQVKGGLPGLTGFGTIARFPGPTLNTIGNLIYRAHHQLPYAPSYTLRGLGAVVQATGFEKILFANQPLRSNRVR